MTTQNPWGKQPGANLGFFEVKTVIHFFVLKE